METRLLKTFTLMDDESGLGFYRRLSSANGLSGWKELARLSEVSSARSSLFARPEHVASMLGMEGAACRLASAREERALGWRALRRGGFDAVCPHCLQESPHIRVAWGHTYVVACPVHKTLLVDRCDACGDRLSDRRELIDYCSCGHHLLSNETRPASPAQLWVASAITHGTTDDNQSLPRLIDVHPDLFTLLVRNLCQLYDPTLTVTRQNAAAPKSVLESVEFLKPLEYLLHEWPRGFEAHVRDRIAVGSSASRTLNTRLGKWYLRLKELGPDDSQNPFLEAVHQLAAREYEGVLALDHVTGHRGRSATHCMLPEAAARIGVHRATMVKAVATGEVAAITRPYANQGVAREIAVAEVEAIVSARRGWISEKSARELLNVPPSVFANMVQAGWVTPNFSARYDIRKGSPIELLALERLQAHLLTGALRVGKCEREWIQLKELHARRLGDKQSIVRLLKAIHSGEVRPLARVTCVGDLTFLRSEVATFFSSKAVEAGLSVHALSRATGWKWESISHWIDEGLLEAEPAVLRGQPCRIVMPEQLIKFSSTYVPLSSLAHSVNARSSELLERLGSIKTFGGKPLPGGAVRGALVRLSDLAQAALLPGLRDEGNAARTVHFLEQTERAST